MKFGPVPVDQAEGAILAHSLRFDARVFQKGSVLGAADITDLRAAGVETVTVARLDDTDMAEDEAANVVATACCASDAIRLSAPVNGRVNVIAEMDGLLQVHRDKLRRVNAVDEGITLATLAHGARASAGALLATAKIIPYAVPRDAVQQAGAAARGCLAFSPFRPRTIDLILTHTPGFKHSLLDKGARAVAKRVRALGCSMGAVLEVLHNEQAVKDALLGLRGDIHLILGASATSDRQDVIPAAMNLAGGTVTRFGMPVDPGNLLVLGMLGERPVVGLPGCARSPALNGADWVLERLVADLEISSDDIADMGEGGLLKEIPQRPQPRRKPATDKTKTVEIVLLAAGNSTRMRGDHKLLRMVDGEPLLRRTTRQLVHSQAAKVHVVLRNTPEHADALRDLPVNIVFANHADEGLSGSIRDGMAAVSDQAGAVVLALADMPDITASHIDALITAYQQADAAAICCPVAPNGKRGNPVLFDTAYFEPLTSLQGDRGARAIIDAAGEAVTLVPTDDAVLIDLDTPEAWDDWLTARKSRA